MRGCVSRFYCSGVAVADKGGVGWPRYRPCCGHCRRHVNRPLRTVTPLWLDRKPCYPYLPAQASNAARFGTGNRI